MAHFEIIFSLTLAALAQVCPVTPLSPAQPPLKVLEGERATEDPKVYTHVKLIYKVTGHKLKPANVERAVNLSAEKYCSASAMFARTAKIEHSFEIIEAGEG